MIIDAWGQHPTLRHSQDPIFDSLRRWTKSATATEPLQVAETLAVMDWGGVDKMLISAWIGPRNVMISNDEVAGFVGQAAEVGRPIYLDQVALDFPELVIVGGHIGYPWTDEAIAVATKHPNAYLDTSAYTVRRYPQPLVQFMREHGGGKVLFGTNYPMITAEKALEGLEDLGLTEKTRARFLGGNAARVFEL